MNVFFMKIASFTAVLRGLPSLQNLDDQGSPQLIILCHFSLFLPRPVLRFTQARWVGYPLLLFLPFDFNRPCQYQIFQIFFPSGERNILPQVFSSVKKVFSISFHIVGPILHSFLDSYYLIQSLKDMEYNFGFRCTVSARFFHPLLKHSRDIQFVFISPIRYSRLRRFCLVTTIHSVL